MTRRVLLRMIEWYQVSTTGRPSPCRYIPSCSCYAPEAIETHGAVKGSWFAARRLSRCHPFGKFGFDPVPPRKAGSC